MAGDENQNNHQPLLDECLAENYAWPLAILTDLDESCQKILVQYVQDSIAEDLQRHSVYYFGSDSQVQINKENINIETWFPSKSLLKSIAQQGPQRDSQANIYALAVLAKQSGRSRILIADEMTKRQIQSVPFRNERQEQHVVTVVTVSTEQKPEFYVYARRTYCFYEERLWRHDEHMNMYNDLPWVQHHDRQILDFKSFASTWGPLWKAPTKTEESEWEGLVLHDPDGRVFSFNNKPVLEHESYIDAINVALGPFLPTELIDEIVLQTFNYKFKMPLWSQAPSENHLVVFLLFDTAADELALMQSNIQQAILAAFRPGAARKPYMKIPAMTVELIPWERHRISTRRDLTKFWDEYRLWDGAWAGRSGIPPILYLTEPFESLESSLCGVLRRYSKNIDGTALTTGKLRLGSICRSIHGSKTINWGPSNYFDQEDSNRGWIYQEKLCDPSQPLYLNAPGWEEAINDHFCIPLFSLSSHLKEQDIIRLQSELGVVREEDSLADMTEDLHEMASPRCVFTPWKDGKADATDGTVRDIWDIVEEIAMHPSVSRASNIEIMLLDRQSVEDSTVILAGTNQFPVDPSHKLLRHLPLPGLPGFEFARVSAKRAWSILHRRFEHRDLEWFYYCRPGWPGPEELPDAYQGDERFVDGNSFP